MYISEVKIFALHGLGCEIIAAIKFDSLSVAQNKLI